MSFPNVTTNQVPPALYMLGKALGDDAANLETPIEQVAEHRDETAVFIGFLQLFLPLMILSLTSALDNMPDDAVPAARVMGANPLQVFWKEILALTREGLVIGGTLVFTGSLTAFLLVATNPSTC